MDQDMYLHYFKRDASNNKTFLRWLQCSLTLNSFNSHIYTMKIPSVLCTMY